MAMAQAKRKRKPKAKKSPARRPDRRSGSSATAPTRGPRLAGGDRHRLREGALFIIGAVAIYLAISLLSYRASDPGWLGGDTGGPIGNAGGLVGAWFASTALLVCGYLSYVLPIALGALAWSIHRGPASGSGAGSRLQRIVRAAGFLLFLLAASGLGSMHFTVDDASLPAGSGGILGDLVSDGLVAPFSLIGATLFLLALFLTGVTLLTGLSWLSVMDWLGGQTLDLFFGARDACRGLRDRLAARQAQQERVAVVKREQRRKKSEPPPRIEPTLKPIEIGERLDKERQLPLFKTNGDGRLPPLDLLDPPEPSVHKVSPESLEAFSRQVELKLLDFGIEVQVVAVHPGPVITRFEMQPAAGVKVSRITNLAKDLARALSAISVRIVEVIPGKSVIGLEIPNERREMVCLREIIQSQAYDQATHASCLTMALGKDVSGQPVVVDLARMPHLLIAGTTGSGKSVGINAMILSLLYNAQPRDLRLIMIDPKMLELSIYEGIPHLLAPVVTDMKEAANALRWCVAEMERRYALMSALGVRNITNYNRKVARAIENGQPIPDPMRPPVEGEEPVTLDHLPLIVVVIDELADMMMIVGKKVEQLIARLAQKARAAGIHLIMATQRPSVDVITGLIKANIPTRIAFQVSSRIDSRTILDQMGAEQLLGHGDMLYLPPGTSVPTRVHGAFVDDPEVHRVVDFLRSLGEPDYIDEVLSGQDEDGAVALLPGESGDGERDALYDQAVRIVTETRRASISGVQRRLKIGYNRAARMVEEMERAGVVGPLESNGNREVLAPPPPAD